MRDLLKFATLLATTVLLSSVVSAENGPGLALGRERVVEVIDLSVEPPEENPEKYGLLLRETLESLADNANYPDQMYAVELGPVTFHLGTQTLVIPDGVNLVGSGEGTRLVGTVVSEKWGLVHVAGRSELSHLSIANNAIDVPDSVAIGISVFEETTGEPWSYRGHAKLISAGAAAIAQTKAIGGYAEAFEPWGTAGIGLDNSGLSAVAYPPDMNSGVGIGAVIVGNTAGIGARNSSSMGGHNAYGPNPGYGVILEGGAHMSLVDSSIVSGYGSAIVAGPASTVFVDSFSKLYNQGEHTLVADERAQIRIKYSEVDAAETFDISSTAEVSCASVFETLTLLPLDRNCEVQEP